MKKVNEAAPVELAYQFIRNKILSGEYPPGHRLMAKTLAGEIKVSRTPVLAVLHRLQTEGLVTIRDRLGAIVKTMNFAEFLEMCEVRLALESHAAGLAARNHTAADLKEIKYALDGMRKSTAQILAAKSEEAFVPELLRQDVHFHIAIMTAAKNNLLKEEILRLHLVKRVAMQPNNEPLRFTDKNASDANRRKVLAMHEKIYESIAEGDIRAAKLAMEEHVQDIIDKNNPVFQASTEAVQRKLTATELAYSV